MLGKNAPNPAFDMILGVDTLRNFGVILNFAESTITIDHHEVIMRPLDAFNSLKHVGVYCRRNQEIPSRAPSFLEYLRNLRWLLRQLIGPWES